MDLRTGHARRAGPEAAGVVAWRRTRLRKAGFDSEVKALGSLKATGLRPKFLEKMQYANVTVDPLLFATGRVG